MRKNLVTSEETKFRLAAEEMFMPELPEVETLCRQLSGMIVGKAILSTEVYDAKLEHIANQRGRRISAVKRRGKSIAISLDDGRCLLIHLRMSGRLLWQVENTRPRHSRFKITFAGGNILLIDPRRFATIKITEVRDDPVAGDILLGLKQASFIKRHGSRQALVKNVIMDQKAIAGIGNIYACEILHRSRISPERRAADLSAKEWKTIFKHAKKILEKAIFLRGTSISDWRDLYGQQGENQHELKVYGREGETCTYCGGIIKRIKQGGRSTFYCAHCQK